MTSLALSLANMPRYGGSRNQLGPAIRATARSVVQTPHPKSYARLEDPVCESRLLAAPLVQGWRPPAAWQQCLQACRSARARKILPPLRRATECSHAYAGLDGCTPDGNRRREQTRTNNPSDIRHNGRAAAGGRYYSVALHAESVRSRPLVLLLGINREVASRCGLRRHANINRSSHQASVSLHDINVLLGQRNSDAHSRRVMWLIRSDVVRAARGHMATCGATSK